MEGTWGLFVLSPCVRCSGFGPGGEETLKKQMIELITIRCSGQMWYQIQV